MNDNVIIIESSCFHEGALTYLEVDNYKEYNHSSQQARNVRSVFTVESMLQGQDLVRLSQERVEKGDNGAFEFSVLLGLDSNR